MNKTEYYRISKNMSLPLRCPILGQCLRRAWTITIFNYIENLRDLRKEGELQFFRRRGILPDNRAAQIIGEGPSAHEGEHSYSFSGTCPEVQLFDKDYAIPFASGVAATSAGWDKEAEPQVRIHECKHFSECPEYSAYAYHQPENGLASRGAAPEKVFSGNPTFYGVTVNLKALQSWIKRLFARSGNQA